MPAALLEFQLAAFRRSRRDIPTYVIEDDRAVVGIVRYVAGASQVELVDLALAEDARGRGIGSAVLAQVLDPARDARAAVAADNVGARRFYARLGFTEEATDGVYVTLRRAARPATR